MTLEATLWAALRALEENAALARRMERWMLQRNRHAGAVQRYTRRAQEAERHAEVLRQVLMEEPQKAGMSEGPEEAPFVGAGER